MDLVIDRFFFVTKPQAFNVYTWEFYGGVPIADCLGAQENSIGEACELLPTFMTRRSVPGLVH